MYAIVEISGKQFKVEKKQKLFVNRLDVAEGKKISFDNVLMVNDGSKSSVGNPNVSGVQVDAKVLKHLKSDKVIVFKKKRRKGYKVRNGHRQAITEIEISDILTGVSKKSTAKKAESKKIASTAKRDFENKVRRAWDIPSGSSGQKATARVTLSDSGAVQSVIVNASDPDMKASVEAAVRAAAPYPMPSDPDARREARTFTSSFTAK